MPVTATKEYIGEVRDRVENFNGKQLLYVSWDQHLLFGSSLLVVTDPETQFREVVHEHLAPLLAADPDAERIDWDAVVWIKGSAAWAPSWDLSLRENGIVHKAHLRFQTPGLNTLCG